MTITDLIVELSDVLKNHGDLKVTEHCLDDEIERVLILNENSEEWTAGGGGEATEVFLEG